MSAHDNWLANYRRSEVEVYCVNRDCPNHEGVEVTLESEYGQSWITPEDCPICHGELLDDPPADEDEEEEL